MSAEKPAKVYDAGESPEQIKPKITRTSHEKCTPGEFGTQMAKQAMGGTAAFRAPPMPQGAAAGPKPNAQNSALRLAKQNNINLQNVQGSGQGGMVMGSDIRSLTAGKPTPPTAPSRAFGGVSPIGAAAQTAAPAPAQRPVMTQMGQPAQPAVTKPINAQGSAQRLAKQHGIDLSTVQGSGENGMIMGSDIRRMIMEKGGSAATFGAMVALGMFKQSASPMKKKSDSNKLIGNSHTIDGLYRGLTTAGPKMLPVGLLAGLIGGAGYGAASGEGLGRGALRGGLIGAGASMGAGAGGGLGGGAYMDVNDAIYGQPESLSGATDRLLETTFYGGLPGGAGGGVAGGVAGNELYKMLVKNKPKKKQEKEDDSEKQSAADFGAYMAKQANPLRGMMSLMGMGAKAAPKVAPAATKAIAPAAKKLTDAELLGQMGQAFRKQPPATSAPIKISPAEAAAGRAKVTVSPQEAAAARPRPSVATGRQLPAPPLPGPPAAPIKISPAEAAAGSTAATRATLEAGGGTAADMQKLLGGSFKEYDARAASAARQAAGTYPMPTPPVAPPRLTPRDNQFGRAMDLLRAGNFGGQ
jgi:hypothetical protein